MFRCARLRNVVATTIAIAGLSSAANAQDWSKIFTNINRVTIFGRAGGFTPNPNDLQPNNKQSLNGWGHAGLGVELGYQVAELKYLLVEADLGYAQMSGFKLAGNGPNLQATVRELPTFSLYGISRVGALKALPYVGISAGLARLQNASVYLPDTVQYAVAAEAFTAGISGGLTFGSPSFAPYVEFGYRYRDFRSLDYKPISNGIVPAALPRSLNFSGWHIDIGMQFGLDDIKKRSVKATKPPADSTRCQCCTCAATPPK